LEAKAHDLDFVLSQKQQWVVPIYQRHYEWESSTDEQIPKLWDDLLERAQERLDADRHPLPHYFGAIIYSERKSRSYGAVPYRYIVDGQQRMTTFQIALAAIREAARTRELGRLINQVNSFLFNDKSEGMEDQERERYKLWPSKYDREVYQIVVDREYGEVVDHYSDQYFFKNRNIKRKQAPKILHAYDYLYKKIDAFVEESIRDGEPPDEALNSLLSGFLSGFQIVVIQLGENDDAQEIFASLNSQGKPLVPFDLIRNSVFQRARKNEENEEDLFNESWKYFENPFWMEEITQGRLKRPRADQLVAHALKAETAKDANVGKIATEYEYYARSRNFQSAKEELQVLIRHAKSYERIEDPPPGSALESLSEALKVWDTFTFNPFILWVLSYIQDDEEKSKILRLLESYIVRRGICGLTVKRHNQITTGFIRAIKEQTHQTHYSKFSEYIASMGGSDVSKMPSDLDMMESVETHDIYNYVSPSKLRYILKNVEINARDKHDETTFLTEDLTVEHVMPKKWAQNWPLKNGKMVAYETSTEAENEGIGMDHDTRREVNSRSRIIHTLGNLTLITGGRNASLGNAGWEDKKKKLGESLLAMNRPIANAEYWNESSIRERGERIAEIIISRWPINYA